MIKLLILFIAMRCFAVTPPEFVGNLKPEQFKNAQQRINQDIYRRLGRGQTEGIRLMDLEAYALKNHKHWARQIRTEQSGNMTDDDVQGQLWDLDAWCLHMGLQSEAAKYRTMVLPLIIDQTYIHGLNSADGETFNIDATSGTITITKQNTGNNDLTDFTIKSYGANAYYNILGYAGGSAVAGYQPDDAANTTRGVFGRASDTGIGVLGSGLYGTGVKGYAHDGKAIHGEVADKAKGWAGYFEGKVYSDTGFIGNASSATWAATSDTSTYSATSGTAAYADNSGLLNGHSDTYFEPVLNYVSENSGGVQISSNVYIAGKSSATYYYGSALYMTDVTATNADTLDLHDSLYFATASSMTDIHDNYATDADVIVATNSCLGKTAKAADSDLLDGRNYDYFLGTTTASDTYYKKIGGVLTGAVTVGSDGAGHPIIFNTDKSSPYWRFKIDDVKSSMSWGFLHNESDQGNYAFQAGAGARAMGDYSLALGWDAVSQGEQSIGIGRNGNAAALNSIYLGYESGIFSSAYHYSIAIGKWVEAKAANNIVIGVGANLNQKLTNSQPYTIVMGVTSTPTMIITKSSVSFEGVILTNISTSPVNNGDASTKGYTDYAIKKATVNINAATLDGLDSLDFVKVDGLSVARAYLATSSAIVSGASKKLFFDAETYDVKSEMDVTTADKGRFTAAVAGYYRVTAQAYWLTPIDQKYYDIDIRRNGSRMTQVRTSASGISHLYTAINDIIHLDAGQYLEIFVHHNSGEDKTIHNTTQDTFFVVERIN